MSYAYWRAGQVAWASMNKAQDAFAEWRQAVANAHTLEVQISAHWDRLMEHSGTGPSSEMLSEVHRLRQVANEKLTILRGTLGGQPEGPSKKR